MMANNPSLPLAQSLGDALAVSALPIQPGSSFIVQHQNYLKDRAEAVLKELIVKLRSSELSYQDAACGLGRIAGYYDLLAEIAREQRRLEEQRQQ